MLCLLFASGGLPWCFAWDVGGYVFCDANQNGQLDSGDMPEAGVLVVVTNTSGTYSNAVYTATPDGGFVLDLPSATDSYVEYLHPLSLPADASVVVPAGGTYAFTLDGTTASNFLGNFLFSSASCASNQPPPPPPATNNNCCLSARGQVCEWNSQAHYAFHAEVRPDCGTTNDTGHWQVVSRELNLQFDSCVLQTVNCGQLLDTNSGCVSAYMDVQGAGILKTGGFCKGKYRGHSKSTKTLVAFYARAVCHGNCLTNDLLYFRAYDLDGTTELLISADTSDATDIAPVPIDDGTIRIGTSSCDQCEGEGSDHGHQGPQGDDQGNEHGGGHGRHGHGQGQNGNCGPGNGQEHARGHGHGNH